MRKLGIATIAFFAFGSAAYAMGGGPYHPAPTLPNVSSDATERPTSSAAGYSGYTEPYVGYSANLGMTRPGVTGWGSGEAWGAFPGSLNANGG
jgi:hypothetical protein